MRLLSNADIARVCDMRTTLDALRRAYGELAEGRATYGPRIDYYAPSANPEGYHQWGAMIGASVGAGVVAVRMKSDIVSWPEGRTAEKYCGEPGTYCGLIMLFRSSDGLPVALMQDGYLQHLRVGAAAGIGTDALALPDADSLGLLGSGGMAWTFVEAIAAVRPLRTVRVYSPTPEHRTAFAARVRAELGLEAEAVSGPEDAVREAAIVATATDAMGPTFDARWLAPGAHVACVTRRELGAELLARADRTLQLGHNTVPHGTPVPMMEWAAGGIACYIAGNPDERARIPRGRSAERGRYPTLDDLLRGTAEGRQSASEITLFIATGTQGLQFAAVAGEVWRRIADDPQIGRELPTEWLLQDIRD